MTAIDDDLDRLLKQRELASPETFSADVMSLVSAEAVNPDRRHSILSALQWIAFGLGGVFGMSQSLYFLFGIWVATAAG